MAIQVLNNGETLGTIRGKINGNFSELDSSMIVASQVLTKTNTATYTPTSDYHPATKSYADSLNTSFKSIYDPTNISGDAFDRANHYGTIAPEVVVQDSDNRFVTDADIGNWNQKEDTIGVKNTAFNKNYGTTTGTTATGDHTHTKQDIGLGNVDNTSDVDKAVSDPTQEALDLKLNTADLPNQVYNKIDFDYSTVPARQEGRIFYDEESQSVSVYTDVDDFTHNLGQEEVTRVYNATGLAIPNGTVCRGDGATDGTPNVAPALADTIANSTVIGIATHRIPADTYGFVTHTGGLSYAVSVATVDQMVYLSDITPGAMTVNAPDIACELGVKLSGSRMQVNINNHKTLPTGVGWLRDLTAQTYDLVADAAATPLVNWAGEDSIFLDVNGTTGVIHVTYAGVYRLGVTFSATFTADGKDARTFYMAFVDDTDSTVLAEWGFPIPVDFATITGTVTAPTRLVSDHDLSLAIRVIGDDVGGVNFSNINFSLESIQIK